MPPTSETPAIPRQRIQSTVERLWHAITELNLFPSSLRQEQLDIVQQRWKTRIYLLCFTFGITILTLFTLLSVETRAVEVKKPSLTTSLYLQLQSEFNSSLQCPCTKITIPYKEIVQLQPFYHQVCSSDFVKQRWQYLVRALLQVQTGYPNYIVDFRFSFQLFFLLESLCQLTNETIFSILQTFEKTELVTGYLLFTDVFAYKMVSAIKQFQTEVVRTFFHFFQLARNITYVNQIVASLNNIQYEVIGSPPNDASIRIGGYSGQDGNATYTCSCANDITCKMTINLYSNYGGKFVQSVVPGLYVACFSVESLLLSTLECFYDDQECLATIINFYNQSWFQNFTQLDSFLPSRFARNSSINLLLAELFIEHWNQTVNYSSYFAQCQPAKCSYKILRSANIFETITTIFGFIGGLSVSLRIFIPALVATYFYLIQRRQRQRETPEPRK